MTVWFSPDRGKGAFAKCAEMQWNVPWVLQGSIFFQWIKLLEFLSFRGCKDIFAALFCPLHSLSSICGFSYEALPIAYRLECSVFIVAPLVSVLECLSCVFTGGENFICVRKWREFADQCFCAAVWAVWVCGHFCTSLNKWNWAHHCPYLCSKLLFLRWLVMHFQGTHGTAAGLPQFVSQTDLTITWELQLRDPCWHPLMHCKSFVLS